MNYLGMRIALRVWIVIYCVHSSYASVRPSLRSRTTWFSSKFGNLRKKMAPALGFEPRTKWLTATYFKHEFAYLGIIWL